MPENYRYIWTCKASLKRNVWVGVTPLPLAFHKQKFEEENLV